MLSTIFRLVLLAFVGLTFAASAGAEEFRIETRVFAGDASEPASESVTLFQEDVVYDFLTGSSQVAIFRRPLGDAPGRFILLDREREIRTEITTDRIATVMGKLRDWASKQDDAYLKFAADPRFEETFNEATGELLLESPLQSYRLTTSPIEKSSAQTQLQDFLNWYTQLNALIHGGPPPFPRLAVNAALARHAAVPLEVQLTTSGDTQNLRSEHLIAWRISKQDRERIDQTVNEMSDYEQVSNAEFHKADKTAAK
ncbi:MAG: hypothetical protein WD851_02565 [Pirellulales bacterium]